MADQYGKWRVFSLLNPRALLALVLGDAAKPGAAAARARANDRLVRGAGRPYYHGYHAAHPGSSAKATRGFPRPGCGRATTGSRGRNLRNRATRGQHRQRDLVALRVGGLPGRRNLGGEFLSGPAPPRCFSPAFARGSKQVGGGTGNFDES